MLKLSKDQGSASRDRYDVREGEAPGLNLAALADIAREQWPLIAACVGLTLGAAVLFVTTARPLFTASTNIVIDTRKNQLFENQQIVGETQFDTGMIESKIEILKSDNVALSALRKLQPAQDADATSSRTAQLEKRAVAAFARGLDVKRVGSSYVIAISFTSPFPERAAASANAVAEAYMVGELDAKFQATRSANNWLKDRVLELREQARIAEQGVATFKADNGIVGTNRGLMSDQQLGDVNAQLVSARATTAEAKAKLDRIQTISQGDLPEATIGDALRSDVITRLRAQYLDLMAREADLSARQGRDHAAAQNMRNQMQEITRSIANEVRRIGETYKSDYEIARSREASLVQSLDTLVNQSTSFASAQVKLRDLESSAQTARNLYDEFLQRSMEATQQQTFPISEARVITPAAVPESKSYPRSMRIVAGASIAGLLLGFGLALLRSQMNRAFRTPGDVYQVLGQETLGIVPRLERKSDPVPEPRFPVPSGRMLELKLGWSRHCVAAPFSRMAETLRSVKVAIDVQALSRDAKVVALTSSMPLEGKTLLACNLATMVASSGRRVLLIDGDLRNPSVSRQLAPKSTMGLLDVLTGHASFEDVVWTDPVTGLDVVTNHAGERIAQSAEILSSPPMAEFLVQARLRYDYVFVDLPPLIPVVDVRAVGHLIDAFVIVIEWGTTGHDVVREALRGADLVRDRLLGVVLNNAPPSALKRVEAYKGRHNGKYYTESAA